MAKILIVDDDEQYPVMIAKTLKKENHEVTISNDSEEALNFCKDKEFDLVITDIFMPKVDGFELIANLRKTTPVIVITGGRHLFPSDYYVSDAIMLGAKVVLEKPFSDEQLFAAIDVALK